MARLAISLAIIVAHLTAKAGPKDAAEFDKSIIEPKILIDSGDGQQYSAYISTSNWSYLETVDYRNAGILRSGTFRSDKFTFSYREISTNNFLWELRPLNFDRNLIMTGGWASKPRDLVQIKSQTESYEYQFGPDEEESSVSAPPRSARTCDSAHTDSTRLINQQILNAAQNAENLAKITDSNCESKIKSNLASERIKMGWLFCIDDRIPDQPLARVKLHALMLDLRTNGQGLKIECVKDKNSLWFARINKWKSPLTIQVNLSSSKPMQSFFKHEIFHAVGLSHSDQRRLAKCDRHETGGVTVADASNPEFKVYEQRVKNVQSVEQKLKSIPIERIPISRDPNELKMALLGHASAVQEAASSGLSVLNSIVARSIEPAGAQPYEPSETLNQSEGGSRNAGAITVTYSGDFESTHHENPSKRSANFPNDHSPNRGPASESLGSPRIVNSEEIKGIARRRAVTQNAIPSVMTDISTDETESKSPSNLRRAPGDAMRMATPKMNSRSGLNPVMSNSPTTNSRRYNTNKNAIDNRFGDNIHDSTRVQTDFRSYINLITERLNALKLTNDFDKNLIDELKASNIQVIRPDGTGIPQNLKNPFRIVYSKNKLKYVPEYSDR